MQGFSRIEFNRREHPGAATSPQARREFWHSVTVFERAGGEQWFKRNRRRVFDVERHFFWRDEERAPSPEIAELTEMFSALGH